MDLDEWLWRNKVKKAHFAKEVGVHVQTIFTVLNRTITPRFSTALAISAHTKGEVPVEKLLNQKDYDEFKELQKKLA